MIRAHFNYSLTYKESPQWLIMFDLVDFFTLDTLRDATIKLSTQNWDRDLLLVRRTCKPLLCYMRN